MMKVEKSEVLKFAITPENHDTIQVYLEDFGPGRGQITITCCGDSWTHYWPAMGDRKIDEFFCDCDIPYLVGKLLPYDKHEEFDPSETWTQLKRDMIDARHGRYGNGLSKDLTRELWNTLSRHMGDISCVEELGEFLNDSIESNDFAEIIYGGAWHDCIRYRKTSNYRYLRDTIIPAIKDVLRHNAITREPKKLWVVSFAVNEYDQYGSYAIAVYTSKPSIEEIKLLGFDDDITAHIMSGGGRRKGDHVWYTLDEASEGKIINPYK